MGNCFSLGMATTLGQRPKGLRQFVLKKCLFLREKVLVFPFLAKVSVVVYNYQYTYDLSTDTRCRWGVGRISARIGILSFFV